MAAVSDKIHTVHTDDGILFTHGQREHNAVRQLCDGVCHEHALESRLTKLNHPRTTGQGDRMNRRLREAAVKTYHDQTPQPPKEHLQLFWMAYNFVKRLKTLRGLTPYGYICQWWQKAPNLFTINPYHYTVGLNT